MRKKSLVAILTLTFIGAAAASVVLADWPWDEKPDSVLRIWTAIGWGVFDAACGEAERYLERSPGDGEIRLLLAMLHDELDDAREAERQYRLALSQPRDRPYLQTVLGGLALRGDDWAKAAAHYREALRLEPAMAQASYGLAKALDGAGKRGEAIAVLQGLLKRTAMEWPEPYLYLGDLLEWRGERPADLVKLYKRGIKDNPNDPELHLRLGRAYEAMGEEAQAREAYAHALYLDPANRAARAALD